MATPQEVAQWRRDEAAAFEGWDFSYIKDRSHQDEPPWTYRDRASKLIRNARQLLDIDTGGGEFLSSLAPLPAGSRAIESYHPNVAVAREHLSPLGIEVSEVAVGAPWPFGDASFDLILNRHGHLNAGQTARTLMPGGTFLTQQVSSGNLDDLIADLGGAQAAHDNTLEQARMSLEAAGLVVSEGQEWAGHQSFRDVGALVYFLRAIPWIVPGFAVETHLEALERLTDRLRCDGVLAFPISRFLVEARKPKRA